MTAIVCGSSPDIDVVCSEMTTVYKEVWKIDDASISYPNAEVIRDLLCKVLPKNAIVLIPHEHFGMDLSPGLSVQLGSVYLPDALDFEDVEGSALVHLAGHLDVPAAMLDDAKHRGQSQAGPLSLLLGGKEWFK